MYFATIITFLYLCYAAWQDYRTLTVPIQGALLPYVISLCMLFYCFPLRIALARLGTAIVLFFVFVAMAYFFGCGGGDAIVIPLMALYLSPLLSLLSVLLGCLLMTTWALLRLRKTKQKLTAKVTYPMLPSMVIAFTVLYFTEQIGGFGL